MTHPIHAAVLAASTLFNHYQVAAPPAWRSQPVYTAPVAARPVYVAPVYATPNYGAPVSQRYDRDYRDERGGERFGRDRRDERGGDRDGRGRFDADRGYGGGRPAREFAHGRMRFEQHGRGW